MMDPTQIAHLFANPWTAVVAVVAAAVETSPRGWLPAAVREWIGWLAVLACAPVALVVSTDVAVAMFSGAGGLIGSWLLVEAVEGGRRRLRATAEPKHPQAADDPPPLLPPPPVK